MHASGSKQKLCSLVFFVSFHINRETEKKDKRNQCRAYIGSTYEPAQGQCLLAKGLMGVLYCANGTKTHCLINEAWTEPDNLVKVFCSVSALGENKISRHLFQCLHHVKSQSHGRGGRRWKEYTQY